jgi:alkylation response protein AidB-like acyl-CoA dehydrogenase
MSDPNPDLDAFRAEARSWLGDHFPATLAGRGLELMGAEFFDDSNAELSMWCKSIDEKGWATPTWPTEYGGGGLSRGGNRKNKRAFPHHAY